jgi:hypothetical protein
VLTSLIIATIFTILGGVLGAVIFSFVVSHSAALNLSAQGAYLGGGVGLLLGLLVLRASLKRATTTNWLHRHGTRITAHVVAVEKKWVSQQGPVGPNGVMSVQSFPAYVIVAHWMDPGTHQPHTFRSQPIRRKKFSPGDPIGVRIDPQNPRRYLVEV